MKTKSQQINLCFTSQSIFKYAIVFLYCFCFSINVSEGKLLCYWKLDQTSGSKVKDYSGNNYHSWMENGRWISENGIGVALECNKNTIFKTPVDFLSSLDNEITIGIWQNMDPDWKNYNMFVSASTNGVGRFSVFLPWNDGVVVWAAGVNNKGECDRIFKPADVANTIGTWNHWVFTRDASGKMSIYINGKFWHSQNLPKDRTLKGANEFQFAYDFLGCIKDVVIFDNALSEQEILTFYRIGPEGIDVGSPLVSILNEAIRLHNNKEYDNLIKYICDNIHKFPKNQNRSEQIVFSDIIFLLADAYHSIGKKEEAQKAYIQSMNDRKLDMSSYAEDLFRVYDKLPLFEIKSIIEKNIRSSDTVKFEIGKIARYLEEINEFELFKICVSSVFSIKGDHLDYAEMIGRYLKTEQFRDFLYSYCLDKPELFKYVVNEDKAKMVVYIKEGYPEKAFNIYEQIKEKAKNPKDKGLLDFELGKALFETGDYEQAIKILKQFTSTCKNSHRMQVAEAMTMTGTAFVQLSKTDEAINEFLSLIIEYPETKQSPEANFFIGYCYMLQGKFEQAKDALDIVIKDHPQSSFASKAKLCLIRIESMTEK